MRRWCETMLPVGVLACVHAAPAVARACTPCITAQYAELADPREQQPGNTGVLLHDVTDVDEQVSVTIDGVAAQLEVGDSGNAVTGAWGVIAPVANIVPTPPVGSIVELSSTMPEVCFGEMAAPQLFVAGPLDESIPEPIIDPWWDLLTLDVAYPQCSDPAAVLFLRGELVAEPETEAMRIVEVSLRHDGQTLFIRRLRVFDPADGVVAVLDRDELDGIDARELCLSTTVVDVAGHRGAASEWICGPCHARHVPDAPEDTDEPRWNDADLVRGTYCGTPASADTTGGTDESTSGEPASTTEDPPTGPPTGPPPDPPSPGTTNDEASSGHASGGDADGAVLDRGCGCSSVAHVPPWLLLVPALLVRRRRP